MTRSTAVAVGLIVATHMAYCAACRQRVRTLDAIGGVLLQDLPPAPLAVGRDTVRLIRRMRWRQSQAPRRYVPLMVAALALLAWFLPMTREPTRAAWRHAQTQVRIMAERVLPSGEIRP